MNAAADHAIVIGASLSGMLAAAVLARHVDRVTVLDRDTLPTERPAVRGGVPQSRHAHALWAHGAELVDALLPGTTAELIAGGAGRLHVPSDIIWLSSVDWFQRVPGVGLVNSSRELVDWTVRRQVTRDQRIRVQSEYEVIGLMTNDDRTAVTGVRVRRRGEGRDAPAEPVSASFVVDASGLGSRTPTWLAALGYPDPVVDGFNSHFGYASRYYRRPSTDPGWQGIYIQSCPSAPRAGLILPIEGDRWIVTLIGRVDDVPPTTEDGYLEFARGLRHPVLYEALRDGTPLSKPVGFRNTANEWRHYERLSRWPRGFVVLGDATCRFNPVYGQGMTVAAMTATAMADTIDGMSDTDLPGAARRIQRAAAKAAGWAWSIATSEDQRYVGTDGPAPGLATKALQRYMNHVVAAANTDPTLIRSLFSVLSLAASPNTLVGPATMGRVLSRWRTPTAAATPVGLPADPVPVASQ